MSYVPFLLPFIVAHLAINPLEASKKRLHIAALLPTGLNPRWVVNFSDVACEMAVEDINNMTTLLRDYDLTIRTNASNCELGLANYQLYEQLRSDDKLVALIAEGCSVVTQPIAETTQYFHLLQFNFLSSSPALEDRTRYPLYHQLLPSETGLNPPRVALMNKLEWKYAVVLFEDAEVFRLVSRDLTKRMRGNNISVEVHLVSTGISTNVEDVLTRVKASQRRIIFGLFYEETGRQVICSAHHLGMNSSIYVWNFVGWFQSKEWYNVGKDEGRNCTSKQMREAVNGHFTVDFAQISLKSDTVVPTGKTIGQVQEAFKKRTGSDFDHYTAYGYDTVVAIALMLNKTIDKLEKKNKTHLLENITYDDPELSLLFNETLVNEVQYNGLIGRVKFGNLSDVHEEVEASGKIVIYFHRYADDDQEFSKLISTFVSEYANSLSDFTQNFSTIDWIGGSKPVDFPPKEYQYSNSGIFIAITTIACFGIVFTIVILIFHFIHREKRIIKLSSPRLNYLIGVGAVFIYVAVILNGFDGQFFYFDSNSIRCCSARTAILVFGFSLAFGSMFAKTWRVSMIMKRSKAGQRNLKLTDHVLFGIVGVLLLIDILLLSLWFGLDPYYMTEDKLKSEDRVEFVRGRCASNNSDRWGFILLAYKGIILVFGAFLAFDTRKVQIVSLNDSRYIALSVYNTVVACILAFAFNFLSDPGIAFALTGFIVIVMATVIVGLVFLPKVYLLLFRGDDNMGSIGRLGSKGKGSLNEHTITKKSELRRLQEENRHHRLVIRMLIEERNLSDETIEKVKNDFGLQLEVFEDSETMQNASRFDSQTVETARENSIKAISKSVGYNGSDSGMGREAHSYSHSLDDLVESRDAVRI